MNNNNGRDEDSNLPHSGPVRRASAPDVLSSTGLTADLIRHSASKHVDATVKAHISKIQKYFCKEYRLFIVEAANIDSGVIHRRRKLLISRATELEAVEESIGAEVAVGIFLFEAILAVSAGVLLVPFYEWFLGYLMGDSMFLIWVVASMFYLTVRTSIVCRDAGRANGLIKERSSFPISESDG